MKPIFQEERDDCFPACVASLLELPRVLVPNWPGGPVKQMEGAQKFLAPLGWTLVEIPIIRNVLPFVMAIPAWCIAAVKVPGIRSYTHAVVGQVHKNTIMLIHDPWKTNSVSTRPPRERIVAVALLTPAIRIGDKRASKKGGLSCPSVSSARFSPWLSPLTSDT